MSSPLVALTIPIAAVSLLSALALGQLLAWRRRRQQRRLGILTVHGKLLAVQEGRPGEGAEMLALTIGRGGREQRVLAPPSALPLGPPRIGKQLAIEAVVDESLPTGEVLYRQNARASGMAAIGVHPRWRVRMFALPCGVALGVAAVLTVLQLPGKADPIRDSAKGVHCLPGARLNTRPDYRGGFIHSCELSDGRRHGDVSQHAADGRLREIQRFEHGIPHGRFRSYYPFGGGRETGEFWHGERHGTWVYRDDDGRLRGRVHFERGLRHGEFLLRDRRGGGLRGFYHHGKRIGSWVGKGRPCRPLAARLPAVLSSGGRLLVEHCNFSHGLLEGPHVIELSGLRISGEFRQGKPEGYWYAAAEDGSRGHLRFTASFEDGRLQGDFRQYHENGSLQLRGQYAAGRRTGLWQRYAPLAVVLRLGGPPYGRLIESWRYRDGVRVAVAGLRSEE